MIELNGKHIVVTGGGAGIGLGIVRQCRALGAQVSVIDIEAKHRDRVTQLGAHFLQADICDPDALKAAVAQIKTCDGLVNNAGITIQKPLAELELADMDTLWCVNQRAVLLLSQLLAPKLAQSSMPAIVNIASNHAKASVAGYEGYAGTKGAVVAMTRAMAWSLGPQGIRVNALAPGLTMTEATQEMVADKPRLMQEFENWHAQPRVNSVDEIGRVAAFLLSDASVAINGAEIVADQGMSARLGALR